MTRLGVFLTLAISLATATDVDYHETLDDYVDFVAMSTDELKSVANCLLDQGPCTDVVASYRKHYPLVVQEACARCNSPQKRMIYDFLERVKKEVPEVYPAFRKLHDPEGTHFDKFEAAVANY